MHVEQNVRRQSATVKRKRGITSAMLFIILLGIISMFSDMTHEGAASIRGAYLTILGASAATVGFISGLGELVGYSLRYVFGALTDKTKKYWTFTIIGYAVDVLAVPALALVGENGWIFACMLLIAERAGKAIKKPAKNTILSFAASSEGVGKSFALQEALDQIGAFLGPLLLYVVMLLKQGSVFDVYRTCFAVLLIPAGITIALLFVAKSKFPTPENFEKEPEKIEKFHLTKLFVCYITAISLFAFGFIDFSLITVHIVKTNIFSETTLPLVYAGAMAIDALSALFFGWLYDKIGVKILIVSTLISSFFSVFVFTFSTPAALIFGVCLWGIGMGAQESIMKAAVSKMIPKNCRAKGYGIFELFFGLFWFLGSWLCGALYDVSIIALVIVSVTVELLSIPLYLLSARGLKRLD